MIDWWCKNPYFFVIWIFVHIRHKHHEAWPWNAKTPSNQIKSLHFRTLANISLYTIYPKSYSLSTQYLETTCGVKLRLNCVEEKWSSLWPVIQTRFCHPDTPFCLTCCISIRSSKEKGIFVFFTIKRYDEARLCFIMYR